jgi:hypothetical protein
MTVDGCIDTVVKLSPKIYKRKSSVLFSSLYDLAKSRPLFDSETLEQLIKGVLTVNHVDREALLLDTKLKSRV